MKHGHVPYDATFLYKSKLLKSQVYYRKIILIDLLGLPKQSITNCVSQKSGFNNRNALSHGSGAGDQNVSGIGFLVLGSFIPCLLPLSLHIVFPPYVFLCPNFPILRRWLFSSSVMSSSSGPHELQHARLPCPSPSPTVCSNTCPLSQWCHPTISSSVVPFSSCHQSFPASGSFPVNWLFASGGQRIRASASVLSVNIQGWFHLGLTSLILLSKGFWRVFSSTTVWKDPFFGTQPSFYFPGASVGRVCLQCKRPRFHTWMGRIPWRRKWPPTPVFLLGESHGQTEEPGGLQSMGSQRVKHDRVTYTFSLLYGPALTSIHDYWKNHTIPILLS